MKDSRWRLTASGTVCVSPSRSPLDYGDPLQELIHVPSARSPAARAERDARPEGRPGPTRQDRGQGVVEGVDGSGEVVFPGIAGSDGIPVSGRSSTSASAMGPKLVTRMRQSSAMERNLTWMRCSVPLRGGEPLDQELWRSLAQVPMPLMRTLDADADCRDVPDENARCLPALKATYGEHLSVADPQANKSLPQLVSTTAPARKQPAVGVKAVVHRPLE